LIGRKYSQSLNLIKKLFFYFFKKIKIKKSFNKKKRFSLKTTILMSAEQWFATAVGVFGLAYAFVIHPYQQKKSDEKIAEHFRGVDARLAEIDRQSEERRRQQQPLSSSNPNEQPSYLHQH